MAPTDHCFRSPPWVLAVGRWIDRLGLGRSVAMLVGFTVLGSMACVSWALRGYPPNYLTDGLQIAAIVATAISTPVSFILARLLADVSRSRAAVYRLAHVDELTRAHSRRHFTETAPGLVASVDGTAVILLDIDHFKQINDRHGHSTGDVVLRAVSDTCRAVVADQAPAGSSPLFARHGGEEFIALLPGAAIDVATVLAEAMRCAIANLVVSGPDGAALTVTASFGLAMTRGAEPERALHEGVTAADRALYAAKRAGRNRTCVDGRPPSAPDTRAPAPGLHESRLPRPEARPARPWQPPPASNDATVAFRSPRWLLAVEDFVVRAGRVKATACSALVSCVGSVLLTVVAGYLMNLDDQRIGIVISASVSLLFSSLISWVLCSLVADVAQARTLLRHIAHFDGLTQAHSRSFFMNTTPALLGRATSAAVVLLDIDNFKGINDNHGHGVGDQVLRAVSDACRATLRTSDLFARYGGEEFVAILPAATAEQAAPVIERMRQAVAALKLATADGTAIRVTASFGLTERRRIHVDAAEAALQQALGAADRALYRSKRSGKNRISVDLEASAMPMSA